MKQLITMIATLLLPFGGCFATGCVASGRHCANLGGVELCVDGKVKATVNIPFFGELPVLARYSYGPKEKATNKPTTDEMNEETNDGTG